MPTAAACLPESSECDAGQQRCCAPYRCWRGVGEHARCGSACPADNRWACHSAPHVGLMIARWGGWPAWMPVLLKTLGAVPRPGPNGTSITFLLLGEAPPASPLPPSVQFHRLTLGGLVRSLLPLGCSLDDGQGCARLPMLAVSGVYASGVSSAKTNDLKPLLGEALAGLLAPYDWWGYLQEDLLVGDLANRFFTPGVLAAADVLSPYPVRASGPRRRRVTSRDCAAPTPPGWPTLRPAVGGRIAPRGQTESAPCRFPGWSGAPRAGTCRRNVLCPSHLLVCSKPWRLGMRRIRQLCDSC